MAPISTDNYLGSVILLPSISIAPIWIASVWDDTVNTEDDDLIMLQICSKISCGTFSSKELYTKTVFLGDFMFAIATQCL